MMIIYRKRHRKIVWAARLVSCTEHEIPNGLNARIRNLFDFIDKR